MIKIELKSCLCLIFNISPDNKPILNIYKNLVLSQCGDGGKVKRHVLIKPQSKG